MNPSFGLKIKTNKSLHLLISVAIANASISLLLNNSTSTNNRIASIWRYQFWNKKQFGVENSQICNFNSFLFPNRLVIHAKGKNATPSYLVKMGKTHKKSFCQMSKKLWDHWMNIGVLLDADYWPDHLQIQPKLTKINFIFQFNFQLDANRRTSALLSWNFNKRHPQLSFAFI